MRCLVGQAAAYLFHRKQGLREWLHVVAPSRHAYELKYYNIDQGAEEEEEKAE